MLGYPHDVAEAEDRTEEWPGAGLGLPQTGRGSLASWTARATALVLDWASSMVIASAIFGVEHVIRGQDWRAFTILGVFFIQTSILTAVAGGSFGKLLTRIGIIRLDGKHIGFLRAVARQFMVCLVIPALVIGVHRRGLHDLTCGTVVVNRR